MPFGFSKFFRNFFDIFSFRFFLLKMPKNIRSRSPSRTRGRRSSSPGSRRRRSRSRDRRSPATNRRSPSSGRDSRRHASRSGSHSPVQPASTPTIPSAVVDCLSRLESSIDFLREGFNAHQSSIATLSARLDVIG